MQAPRASGPLGLPGADKPAGSTNELRKVCDEA